MNTLRVDTTPVGGEATQAVYIAGKDEPIFFPPACIRANCPGLGTEYAITDAIDLLSVDPSTNQLPIFPKELDPKHPQVRDMAHSVTKRLAEGAVAGNCEMCLLFEGCWRRVEDEAGQQG